MGLCVVWGVEFGTTISISCTNFSVSMFQMDLLPDLKEPFSPLSLRLQSLLQETQRLKSLLTQTPRSSQLSLALTTINTDEQKSQDKSFIESLPPESIDWFIKKFTEQREMEILQKKSFSHDFLGCPHPDSVSHEQSNESDKNSICLADFYDDDILCRKYYEVDCIVSWSIVGKESHVTWTSHHQDNYSPSDDKSSTPANMPDQDSSNRPNMDQLNELQDFIAEEVSPPPLYLVVCIY